MLALPGPAPEPDAEGAAKAAEVASAGSERVAEQVPAPGGEGATGAQDGSLASPLEVAREFCRAVAAANAAALGASAGDAAALPAATAALVAFGDVLPTFAELFRSGAAADGQPLSGPDLEARLSLAAAYFDCLANLRGSQLARDDGDFGRTVVRFLEGQVRTSLENEGPGLAEDGLAAALRSLHRAFVASRGAPSAAAAVRRAGPLLARCLASAAPCGSLAAPLVTSAADLFQGVVSQGNEEMQAQALEELLAVSGSCRAPQSTRKNRAAGPSIHTAAFLRAVCAACLPVGIGNAGDAAGPDPTEEPLRRWRAAEARAGDVAAAIVRRCLLAVRDRETDPEPWARLEVLVRELLDACLDPSWISAPTVLLCLSKCLARVAGAARSTDVVWMQRDLAVRLLGQVAAILCREDAASRAASEAEAAEDLTRIRGWAAGPAQGGRSKPGVPEGPQEATQLLLQFLGRASAPKPGVAGQLAKGDGHVQVDAAVLTAEHPVYACSFLLCAHVGEVTHAGGMAAPSGRRRSSGTVAPNVAKRPRKSTNVAVDASGQAQAAGLWKGVAVAWRALALLPQGSAIGQAPKVARRREVELLMPCITRLYRKMMHRSSIGALARTRMVALEALQAQLRGSPLAFVRRQAVAGLGTACAADARLVGLQSVGEAMALGLQDDSPCVRVASIDLLGKLLGGGAQGVPTEHLAAFRLAVGARLSDPSCTVRRAAFRVACAALDPKAPGLATSCAELLHKVRYEAVQVRDTVLGALERVLLAPTPSQAAVQHLADIARHLGAGGTGIRDVLRTHRAVHGEGVLVTSTKVLAAGAFESISKRAPDEDVSSWTAVLEQVGVECPQALHERVPALIAWLDMESSPPPNAVLLAQQACRILSDTLPSWAAQAKPQPRSQLGCRLRKCLAPLFNEQGSHLTRAAAECLCVVAVSLDVAAVSDLRAHVGQSLDFLQETVTGGAPLDSMKQRCICRHAWILGTVLEHVEEEVLQTPKAEQSPALPPNLAQDVLNLFVVLCFRGPPPLKPSLVHCIGFILRRHSSLLQSSGKEGALDVFRVGLANNGAGPDFQAQSIEAFAALLAAYERLAEAEAPASGPGGWGETVADSMQRPKISEAVQRLSGLQPQVLAVLRGTKLQAACGHAIAALASLSRLGVLHPASALPDLLAASLAGFPSLTRDVQRLLLRLVETAPVLLLSRLGAGLRAAAERLSATPTLQHGSVAGERWRFAFFCDAYAAGAEAQARRADERLLDCLVAEVECVASTACLGGPPARLLLLRAELLYGLLAALPYRSEPEVARLVAGASRLLALRAAPLLLQDETGSPRPPRGAERRSAGAGLLGACAAATLLHELCKHFCAGCGSSAAERLLAAGAGADDGAAEDKPLPAGFSRRPTPNVAKLLAELLAAADDRASLQALLIRCVPLDSPLLRGSAGAVAAGTKGTRAKRGGLQQEPEKKPEKPEKPQGKAGGKRRLSQRVQGSAELEAGAEGTEAGKEPKEADPQARKKQRRSAGHGANNGTKATMGEKPQGGLASPSSRKPPASRSPSERRHSLKPVKLVLESEP